MPQGVQHRVVSVGIDRGMLATLTSMLRARGAELSAVCPDIPAAHTEALNNPGENHLFLVQLGASEDPSRLTQLSSSFPGQPVLALLPANTDIARILATQRAGAAQVVTLPLVEADFLQALDCLLLQFAPPPREAHVLAVCGVSGGCGATTLALNLACELAHNSPTSARRSVLLVELTRGMGTLATYLDIAPQLTTHELVRDSHLSTTAIRRAAVHVAAGLDVIAGPYQDLVPGAVLPRNVYQFIELCRKIASHVVLDVPCALDDLQFETLALANQVVLVGVQSVSSIRTLKMVRDTLEREQAIQDQVLVLNRYDPTLPGFSAARIATLLDVPKVLTVANDYPSVMAALNHAKPLQFAVPHSPVVADIRNLASRLGGGGFSTSVSGEPSDRLTRALGQPQTTKAARPLRVLHIEDDPVQQEAVALRLGGVRAFAVSITAVPSEAEAVAAFRRQECDLVLLDYHLAQGDGLECLRQLRQIDAIVPILVISGVNQPQIAAELLAAGADDFLSKENLGSEQLSRSMLGAIARSEACKQRLGVTAEPTLSDTAVDRLRAAFPTTELSELLSSLVELHQHSRPSRLSAAQIQRLVDLVSAELEQPPGSAPPRRALLSLFLRLFSPQIAGPVLAETRDPLPSGAREPLLD